MNQTKIKWSEPEIIDLSVKETKAGKTLDDSPDGKAWVDGDGYWHRPFGKS